MPSHEITPPLKILLVSHFFPPHMGGIENVVAAEAQRLSERGHEVEVITTKSAADAETPRVSPGFRVTRCAAWNGLERRAGIPFPVLFPTAIKQFATATRAADVVHVHDVFYMTTWLASFFSMLWRKPLVLTQHVHLVKHDSKFVMSIQRLVYRTVGRRIFRRADGVLFVNGVVRDFARSLGAQTERMTFLPNGVDTDLFRPATEAERTRIRRAWNLPPDDYLALFVGRYVPKKGFPIARAATRHRHHLVLAGGDDIAPDDGVSVLGRLTQTQLAEVYRACDVFVLPSVGEGFPLSVQEAMASGLAVVTTDDPAYSVYCLDPQMVMLVEPVADAVRKALDLIAIDSDRRAAMSTYSRKFAENEFRWPVHIERIEHLYQGLRRAPASRDSITR